MPWALTERVMTSAGEVAAGRSGEGPTLILAHGWPWSSVSWHRIIPALEQRFTVYWYDMPGYGQSSKEAEADTSLGAQGVVFGELVAHWGLSKPRVVAHDFGGATTLRAHLLHGVDFDAYVLMNAVAMRPWGSEFFEHVGRHVDAFTGLPDHIHRAVVRAYIQGALVRSLEGDDLEKLVTPWLTPEGRVSFYRQFAQADERYTAEVEPTYGDIRCKVSILWGADDPWIPLARGRALHERIPHASLNVLHGAGHMPQLETPQAVIKALQGML